MNIIDEMVFQLKVFLCVVAVAAGDSVQDFTKTTQYSSIPSKIPYSYPSLVKTYSIHPTITTYSNGQVETDFGDVPHRSFSANQDCPNCQSNVPEVRIGAHTKYSRLKAGKSIQFSPPLTNYVPETNEKPDLAIQPGKIVSYPVNNVGPTISAIPSSVPSSSTTSDIYKNLDQTSASYSNNVNSASDTRLSENISNTAQTRSKYQYPVSKFTITYVPIPPVSNPLKYDENNEHLVNSNKDILRATNPAYYYNVETVKSDGTYYSGPQVYSNPNFLTNTAIPFYQNSYVTPTADPSSSKNAFTQSTTSIYPSIASSVTQNPINLPSKEQNLQISARASDDFVVVPAEGIEYAPPLQSFPSYSSTPDISSVNYNNQQVGYN